MKYTNSLARDERVNGWLFMAPFAILAAVFLLLPCIATFLLSFREYSLLDGSPFTAGKWVGLQNYADAFTNPVFIKALKNTLLYAVVVVPVVMVLALVLALACNADKIKGKSFFRTAYYIPAITSMVAVSAIILFVFKPEGAISQLLNFLGITEPKWFTDPNAAMFIIIIAAIWMSIGGTMVMFLAGLQRIDPVLYEAAAIDGASAFQRFVYITLPEIRPIFFVNFVGMLIGSLGVGEMSFLISGGSGGPADGTMTMVLHMIISGFNYLKMGYACAVAFSLVAIIMFCTIIQKKIFKA